MLAYAMRIDLSDQSIDAVVEVISGGASNSYEPVVGLYRTGPKIQQWMGRFGLTIDLNSFSRVSATRTALIEAIATSESSLIKSIIERAADPRDFVHDPERHAAVIDYLNRALIFDGLRLVRTGHRVELVSEEPAHGVVTAAGEIAAVVSFDTVQRDLERGLRSAGEDPEDAVTAACSMVESVCRSILVELDLDLPKQKDIQGLYIAVREPLGLAPGKEGVPDLIASDVRAILGGLNTVVFNIGALRTHAGDAHGRERRFRRIDERIAQLALHSASSVAVFLIQTWRQKFPERVLHRHD